MQSQMTEDIAEGRKLLETFICKPKNHAMLFIDGYDLLNDALSDD